LLHWKDEQAKIGEWWLIIGEYLTDYHFWIFLLLCYNNISVDFLGTGKWNVEFGREPERYC